MAEADPGERADEPVEPRGIGETLLDFARPILPADPSEADGIKTQAMLELAQLVWNEEVFQARGEAGGVDGLEEFRRGLPDLPAEALAELEQALSILVERKRERFAGDLRIIREIRVRNDAKRGIRRITVKASQPKRPGAAPREPKTSGFVANMRDYLRGDLPLGQTPHAALALIAFSGAVAFAASLAPVGGQHRTEVPCRKRTAARRCIAPTLVRRLSEDGPIEWRCSGCGDRGTIEGWRGSPWDAEARGRRLSSLPPGERIRFELTDPHRLLLDTAPGLHVDAAAALAAARRSGKGWTLDAAREEIEDLAVAATSTILDTRRTKSRKPAQRIREHLHALLGIDDAHRPAAETAERLSFFSRVHRAAFRTMPRLASPGAHRLSVVLERAEPRVRRELVVASDTTLEELHALLQVAFGWGATRIYGFDAAGRLYVRADYVEGPAQPSNASRLMDVAPRAGDSLAYDYDLPDAWTHAIQVVDVLPLEHAGVLPRCLFGEGATPPEHLGGPDGYANFRLALADPAHPDRANHVAWFERPFDPYAFDLEATNRWLRQLARWQA